MMRLLVVQITRLGDVVQTSPLIRSLKRTYPDASIDILVRHMGQAAAERHPDVDAVLVYDEDGMFNDLRAADSERLLRAYETAKGYVRRIRERGYARAYNCTHSITSAMLLKLAGVPEVVGAHISDDGRYVLRGGWVNYFFASIFHRRYNALNLCDIMRHFGPVQSESRELVFDVREADAQYAQKLLATSGLGHGVPYICLQLGASQENKRWPVSHFADVASELAQSHGVRPVLLGVESEGGLGEEFERYAPGLAAPLFGKTTIPQAAAVLERSRVLITNDTGTMHIAAAVGCPVLLVSVGWVHFRETGPYGAGHLAIERRRRCFLGGWESIRERDAPEEAVPPEHVVCAAQGLLDRSVSTRSEGGHAVCAGRQGGGLDWSDYDLFRSDFAPDGFLEWYPVLRRFLTEEDFLRAAYRAMWLEHLGAGNGQEAEKASAVQFFERFVIPEGAALEDWRAAHRQVFEELAGMAGAGCRQTEELLGILRGAGRMRDARAQVSKLMALDEQIRLFGELHDAVKPLVLIGRFERDNLEGADPVVLAETTLGIYRDLRTRSELMVTKLDQLSRLGTGRI